MGHVRSWTKTWPSEIAEYVYKQIAAGRIRRVDAPTLVDQFCEMCCGAISRQRLMNVADPPSIATVDKTVESAVQVILVSYARDGISPPRTTGEVMMFC